ncbi:hypothetical protein [Amycolatopsis sp. lyj-90]|uniref:hypothetical protein n=1 Tax=Amycolatopsis sp. lyj-90 TaxID=2789285 RepID=UPI003979648B
MENESRTSPSRSRAALWSALVISTVANAVVSASELSVSISIGFGLMALFCGVALIASRRKKGEPSGN